MPPWLPSQDRPALASHPALTEEELKTLKDWVINEAKEGPVPAQTDPGETTWSIGSPQRIISFGPLEIGPHTAARYHTLVHRNEATETQYIQAAEIDPGIPRALHMAQLLVAPPNTNATYKNTFDTLAAPPNGHLIQWTPIKTIKQLDPDMAWALQPGEHLVLKLLARPSQQPRSITPRVGLHITTNTPSRITTSLVLQQTAIDIPAGVANYPIHDSFTTPVDVFAYAIAPGARQLCQSAIVSADLPQGETVTLLNIPNWRYLWNDAYHFQDPIFLPKGSVIHLDLSYDNSAGNSQNPFSPPRRITQGSDTTNEVARVHLQLLPRVPAHHSTLQKAALRKQVDQAPQAWTHYLLADTLREQKEYRDAAHHYQEAIRLQPHFPRAYLQLGNTWTSTSKLNKAIDAYSMSVEQDQDNAEGFVKLGNILQITGDVSEALEAFQIAIEIEPGNQKAKQEIQRIRRIQEGQ